MNITNTIFSRVIAKAGASTGVKKMIFALVLASAATVAGLGVQQASADRIEDCTDNSVINCGVGSASELITTIKADKTGELKAIYGDLGIKTADYDAFKKEAVQGLAKTDGTILVDGKVVATATWSVGRNKKSYSSSYKIGTTTYYKSDATDVLSQDLPALVWLDANGKVKATVLMACGNPMGGKNVTPSYKCDQLHYKKVADRENTYSFTTTAPLTGMVDVSKVVYDFGDGTKDETRISTKDAVEHTFKKDGTFKVKATVYVKLANGKEVAVNGDGCVKELTIKAPKEAAWQCVELKATVKTNSDDEYVYTLRANGKATNATLVSGDFDFGDGTTQLGVKPAEKSGMFVTTNHTYKTGDHTVKAVLKFEAKDGAKADGDNTDTTCAVTFAIAKPATPVSTPTTPQVLGKVTAVAAELPATGPAGLVGIFTGTSALGTVGYRLYARRRLSKIDDLVDRLRR